MDELELSEYRKISDVFEEDIYEAIALKTCVDKRNTKGAPGSEAIQEEIDFCRNYIAEECAK